MYTEVAGSDLDVALFGLGAAGDSVSAATNVGLGALALAVGRARALSGLPISFEEAAASIVDAAEGAGSAAAKGLIYAVNAAGELFATAIRQAASDTGLNLAQVSQGFDVLRAAYTPEGNRLADQAAALFGGGTAATAASYSIVYVGTLLYQQGVFDSLLSTIKTAVLNNETLTKIGEAFGLVGAASPAAGAFIGAAVGTLRAMWSAWETYTHVTIGKEPPASYWGQITAALYAWDGSGCGPSWGTVKARNSPVFDPILREWQVLTDYSGKPKRLIDVYGRAKLRTAKYKSWVSRSNAGCTSIGAVAEDAATEPRYNSAADGGIYNPSAWSPNSALRMRGVAAPFYCAHALKVSQNCDGSGRDNNICRAAAQIGPGTGSNDQSYTLRGALVAAAYLGANVAGIQNLGNWDDPNCGVGSGTWIAGRFWDLGIGGTSTKDTSGNVRLNWYCLVLVTGQVLVRPPMPSPRQLAPGSSTTYNRKLAMGTGVWYPLFPWTSDDKTEFDRVIADNWVKVYENLDLSGEIPLTIANGIAQQSPKPVISLKAIRPGMKPLTVGVHYKAGDRVTGTGMGRGAKIALWSAGGLAVAGGGYALWRRSRRGR